MDLFGVLGFLAGVITGREEVHHGSPRHCQREVIDCF